MAVLPRSTDYASQINNQDNNTLDLVDPKAWEAQGVLGAKNLLNPASATSKTQGGVTFTVNADKSISLANTATENVFYHLAYDSNAITLPAGSYIFSGGVNTHVYLYMNKVSDNSTVAEAKGSETTFTLSESTLVKICAVVENGQNTNTMVLKPMIRLAADVDSTYRPYVPTNEDLDKIKLSYKDNTVLGAKNLLPNNAVSGSSSNVSWVVDSDGSVTITTNGTASGDVTIWVYGTGWGYANAPKNIFKKGVEYTLTDGNGDATTNTYFLAISVIKPDGTDALDPNTAGTYGVYLPTFTVPNIDNLGYLCYIRVKSGATVNKTIKPMVRLASDFDDTYVPYSETNQELTLNKMSYEDNAALGVHNINFCEYATKTVNNVTFTVNADNSVTLSMSAAASGEAVNINKPFIAPFTGEVILSGGISNNCHIYAWDEDRNARAYTDSSKTALQTANAEDNIGVKFYIEKGVRYSARIRVFGNTPVTSGTFYPMIRRADDSDTEYSAPAKTNSQLSQEINSKVSYNDNTVLGAKNRIPFNLMNIKNANETGVWNGNAYTLTDTTFTFNNDGTVAFSGTPAETRYMRWDITIPKGSYILSGGVDVNKFVALWKDSNYIAVAYGNETFFTVNEDTVVGLTVRVGASSSAISGTFKPMIRLATDNDSTFAPHAKTNRELTEAILTNATSTNSSITLDSDFKKVVKIGSLVQFKVRFTVNTALSGFNLLFSTGYGVIDTSQLLYIPIFNREAPYAPVTSAGAFINENGGITVSGALATGTYDINALYLAR